MSLVGQTLGQYHIVEFIGAGGMASVYKAFQPSLDRYVAVKILPAQHALTSGYKERFVLESRAVAQLSHPNILPIYDFGIEGDLSYFVMKFVPDRTLADMMGRPIELDKVSHFMDQAAKALDHAHDRGILHRDVKPANMLLEGDWLLLADFGMAKITESSTNITSSGHVFGTPAYVSPEQADGKPLDHRTDIYSLGIVLYEMVVGRVPFEDTTPMRVIFKHIYEAPPLPRTLKPDLPEAVEQIILKALAKNPADRYHHAGELAAALQQTLEVIPVPALAAPIVTASSPKRAKRTTRKPAAAPRKKERVNGPQPAKAPIEAPPPVATPVLNTSSALPVKPGQTTSIFSTVTVGGGLLLLILIGVLIFFARSGDAEGLVLNQPTPSAAPPTEVANLSAPTRAATATLESVIMATVPVSELQASPAAQTPTPSPETATSSPVEATAAPAATFTPLAIVPAATPQPAASIEGTLAIPVIVGGEFKVFLTGFDGAGINGPAPVSLGNARQPMFRRDGQAIIVSGTVDGPLRGIFVTDSLGRAPNELNDRSEAYWPVWSPDGSQLLFVDLDQGRTVIRQSGRLAVADTDFSQMQANGVNIVANNIVWSDDNRLVFQGCADWLGQFGECGIWVTPLDTIDPVRLTVESGLPTDARSGQLTYMSAQDGDWDIYRISLAGGQPENLTNNTSQDGMAAIAPDGQSVAYISNESGNWAVWTVTLADKQKQKWFDLDPQRGTIDVNSWSEDRMSWTGG